MDTLIIALGIILALAFNFVNGLNDAANSIATIIATKSLSPPIKAVALATFSNLLGPLIFTTAIAATIGKGIVDSGFLTTHILLAAMFGAVIWVFTTSMLGIPISSSHALIGGLLGAGIAGAGVGAILWPEWDLVKTVFFAMAAGGFLCTLLYIAVALLRKEEWRGGKAPLAFLVGVTVIIPALIIGGFIKITGILAVVIFIVISPMLGLISSFVIGVVIMYLCSAKNPPSRLNAMFRPLTIAAGSFQAIGHGANDAQNAMGVITAMLVAGGILSEFSVPIWVILASCGAISLGTLLGGWRVVDKMANKITKIRPYQGFAASMAGGGGVLSLMTSLGVPVSTTHAMSGGAIMGAGATRGYSSAVRWGGIVREIVVAWIITICNSGCFLGGICFVCLGYSLISYFYPCLSIHFVFDRRYPLSGSSWRICT
ncbi:inorganic phosphate transporter [Methanogenium cariaci]|uniref:inorganic phosphate transporter n=1 Tax=Methanogenium cariaci TaxID=2197 RepID=UPI0009FB403A|nr:inorganic phosphate transporter [Methanogenium cariaci]